ncbi:MAG: DUF4292 domain-containing protein [Hydrogenimonas sp.]|nr:DUF4292 domain-containing protein [Hydrogenimonas sp.]
MIRFLITVIAALSLTSALQASESVNKANLLNKMVEAYGGEKALSDAKSYIQNWKVVRAADKKEGSERRRVTLPERLYVDLRYPDKEEIRALEGNVGVKIFDRHSKKQVFGPMLDAMKAQLMRLYTPLNLKESIESLKVASKDGFYVIYLLKNGVECDYYVNPKNYHIEKTVGRLKMGNTTMEFVTLYDDFKRVGGVLFPGKEVKYAGGVNTATNTLIKSKIVHIRRVGEHKYESI